MAVHIQQDWKWYTGITAHYRVTLHGMNLNCPSAIKHNSDTRISDCNHSYGLPGLQGNYLELPKMCNT